MATQQSFSPNLWDVAGGGICVRNSTLAVVGPASGAHLQYQDGSHNQNSSGDQIRVAAVSDLGAIVSVTIQLTVDSGSTTFSMLLPQTSIVQQGPLSSVPISTKCVVTHHSGSLAPPLFHGQQALYNVLALYGTASHVLVA
jgi:hypothetical protein